MTEIDKTLEQYYLLVELYRKEKNYKIINYKNNNNNCYVFFTSQNIYDKPYDVDGIKNAFLKDRYEWENIAQNKTIVHNCSKQIFIRDIGKQLYQRGINEQINSIDKLIEFIKIETKGMDVYLVGSSSGGYISFIASQLENVKRVYSIGGLVYIGEKSTYIETKNRYHDIDSKYINVASYINHNVSIIHFFGSNNQEDIMNAALIKGLDIKECALIPLKSDSHAPRPPGYVLIKLLTCKESFFHKINKCVKNKKHVSEIYFSICAGCGVHYAISYVKTLLKNKRAD